MKAVIISVGTELLFGQITNTNSVYLSQQLQLLGMDVLYHHTVGDNPERFRRMLKLFCEDCDLIVTTGGLGPTQDDLTKEILTEVMEDQLVLPQPSLDRIEGFFKRLNRPMTENNRKQAYLPSRAILFENAQGTAPGFALENKGKTAICLPGPPREMYAMFEGAARPYLEAKSNGVIYYKMLRTFALGESALETAIEDLIEAQTDPTLATYAKEGECSLRIASKRETAEEARKAVDDMQEIVNARIGKYVFSDRNEDLSAVVGRRLIEDGVSISCAESCTGGAFAAELSGTAGISAVFERGFVTYSNRSKTEELGVPAETIETYGAVSRETALAMAGGLAELSGSRIAISITGIMGPDGGSAEKPVGLAYIGCVFDGREICEEIRTRNVSRGWNRNYAVLSMFYLILRLLDGRR
jgi:nicotinamide-nucleotide amidase